MLLTQHRHCSAMQGLTVLVASCPRLWAIRLDESLVQGLPSRCCLLMQEFTDVQHVDIVSKAELKLDPSLNIRQLSTLNDDTRVTVYGFDF